MLTLRARGATARWRSRSGSNTGCCRAAWLRLARPALPAAPRTGPARRGLIGFASRSGSMLHG
eukprot:9819523-Alexandrium_andersonii.AAC.1